MLLDPSGRALGMDAMLPYFQVLPFADMLFRDLTFSGWALLIVNGLTNLTAACHAPHGRGDFYGYVEENAVNFMRIMSKKLRVMQNYK